LIRVWIDWVSSLTTKKLKQQTTNYIMKMNKSIKTSLSLAAIALTAASANAAIIATYASEDPNLGGDDFHDGPIVASGTDLFQTVGTVAAEGGTGDGTRQNTSTLFDGLINTGIANGAQTIANAGGYWGPGHFIEIDLDTTTNTLGYDISSISTMQVGDGFRPGQGYTVQLRTVVGGSFSDLFTVPGIGTAENVNEAVISNDSGPLLGTGVDGIRFNFADSGNGFGWTVYRELDAVGTATVAAAVPEPTTTALLGLGGLALILRRRK
jgi:hypothetical protein